MIYTRGLAAILLTVFAFLSMVSCQSDVNGDINSQPLNYEAEESNQEMPDLTQAPKKHSASISEVELIISGMAVDEYHVQITETSAVFTITYFGNDTAEYENYDIETIRRMLDEINFETWETYYPYPYDDGTHVADGEYWQLSVRYEDGSIFESEGNCNYPDNWRALYDFFNNRELF